jgi:hypothetical protein
MMVPITAYIMFNVCSDCDVTVNHIYVSYYILIKIKNNKFQKKNELRETWNYDRKQKIRIKFLTVTITFRTIMYTIK